MVRGGVESDENQRLFREEGAALVLFNSIFRQMSELYGEQAPQRVEA